MVLIPSKKTVISKPAISQSLELPDGYQQWDWYKEGVNPNGVWLNSVNAMTEALQQHEQDDVYLYTQHEIFYDGGVIKQTRSTPNWEGGLVTFCNCKHNMRTYQRDTWVGAWLVGLCPKECEDNTMLFAGRIDRAFDSHYGLSHMVYRDYPQVALHKLAHTNPRGDLYIPKHGFNLASSGRRYHHNTYIEPVNHCRAVETYRKSPGSTMRADGTVPKWWRDLEYLQRGIRPQVFILQPCYLFSKPMLWTSRQPKRAVMRLTVGELARTVYKG
jgi:hypothetical protein